MIMQLIIVKLNKLTLKIMISFIVLTIIRSRILIYSLLNLLFISIIFIMIITTIVNVV
ncbi:unnamed protein product [Schistosoma curassoni]|uniref:Uncharacterized protein n=1 Tax=Schistosoma curassoni TaxID=6186 RepID=A0A183L4V7_9TREM|nr:unnamed protein product [Schistosoma curassoni]